MPSITREHALELRKQDYTHLPSKVKYKRGTLQHNDKKKCLPTQYFLNFQGKHWFLFNNFIRYSIKLTQSRKTLFFVCLRGSVSLDASTQVLGALHSRVGHSWLPPPCSAQHSEGKQLQHHMIRLAKEYYHAISFLQRTNKIKLKPS